jgi:hypothetical protein
MTINRIDTLSYQTFLNKNAMKKWKSALNDDVSFEIMHLSENHPYYVNALCRRLWRNEKLPTISDVRNAWNEYVQQQGVWITDDLSNLSLNRRKVLTALAYQPTNEPQGQNFSASAGLNPSGIKKSLMDLQKLDMVYVDQKNHYRLLDPAVAYFLRQHALT